MSLARRLIALSLLLIVAFATGCSAAAPEEAKTQRGSKYETNPLEGMVDPNTLFIRTDESYVHVTNERVSICEEDALAADDYGRQLINQLKHLDNAQIYAVISRNGTFEGHKTTNPVSNVYTYYCGHAGKFGGTSWDFQFYADPDAGFLSNLSLTGAFQSLTGFSGENVGCEGSGSISMNFKPQMHGFKIINGKIKPPSFDLGLEAKATAAGSARCYLKKSSGPKLTMVGFVPVVYEVQAAFGVQVSVSKATQISAMVGTEGGKLESDDPEVSITPQVELGVTFYGVIGGVVGVDFPITAKFKSAPGQSCTPEVTMGVTLRAGLQAGLLGFGNLPVSKAIGFEISASVLGPFTIVASQCTADAAPAPAPAPAPACACYGGRGLGGIDLGPVACGDQVCGEDSTLWSCNGEGAWVGPGDACFP